MTTDGAICIRCGYPKAFALDTCESCGYEPTSSEEMAKSLILAPLFDVGDETFGRSADQLARIGSEIRSGRPYVFDAAEIRIVAASHDEARSVTSRQLVLDGIRWLAPPLLFLAAFFWIISRRG